MLNQFPNSSCGSVFHKVIISFRAERRRREARREIFTTPGDVTARRSILGPPAEGRPGPSDNNDNDDDIYVDDDDAQWARRGGVRPFWGQIFLLFFWPPMAFLHA